MYRLNITLTIMVLFALLPGTGAAPIGKKADRQTVTTHEAGRGVDAAWAAVIHTLASSKLSLAVPSASRSPYEGLDAAGRVQIAQLLRNEEISRQTSDSGAALLKSGRIGDSVGVFQQALALDPSNAEALYGLAKCAKASGDVADELNYYRTAIYAHDAQHYGLVPGDGYQTNDAPRLMEFALVLNGAGQIQEAVAVYDHAAGLLNHEDGKEHALEADLPEFGDGPRQASYSPQALEAMAHLAIGIETFGHEGYGDPEPLANFKQALTLAPDSAAANFYMGKYLYGKSAPGAKAFLEKAVRLGDDHTAASAKGFLQFLH